MKTLGRYRILETISSSDLGNLVRAHDTVLDRPVALKLVPDEVGLSPALKLRFLDEVRTWARLRHENLVAIHDVGEAEGCLYVAMELLDGEALASLLAARRPAFLEDRISVMTQVCDALHHAHQHGLVHRDLRPDNVIVLRSGQVKLLTLGLAPLLSATPDASRPHLILGAFGYLAPEQTLGQFDHRVDVFAAGALLYELLAFRPAFPRGDPLETLERVRAAVPVALADPDEVVPSDLVAIAMRAMDRDPERRFPDLAEMHAALEFVRRRFADEPERLAAYARGQLTQLRELQATLAERVEQMSPHPAAQPVPVSLPTPLPVPDPRPAEHRRRGWLRPAAAAALAAGVLVAYGVGLQHASRLGAVGAPTPVLSTSSRTASVPALTAGPPPAPVAAASVAPTPTRPVLDPPAPDRTRATVLADLRTATQAAQAAASAAREAEAEVRQAAETLRQAAVRAPVERVPVVMTAAPAALPAPALPPAPEPGFGERLRAAFGALFSPERDLEGTTGPLAWKVQDVRYETGSDGEADRWSYTLVLRDRSGAGLRLVREERSVGSDRRGLELERARLDQELAPYAELQLPVHQVARRRGREDTFGNGVGGDELRVWHRFHATDDAGSPIRIDVRFRLDASGESL
jgi:serine/threonine-protein kinase